MLTLKHDLEGTGALIVWADHLEAYNVDGLCRC